MAENRVIGRAGGLPWRLAADLRHFRRLTMGHPVIMGRKTFRSIGRALPGRRNIVVTRDAAFRAEGVETAADIDGALDRARETGADAAMVIGGGQVYAQTLDRADHIELTEVHRSVDGDTVFPELDPAQWRETGRQRHEPETEGGPAYSFVTLDRIAPAVTIGRPANR